MALRVSLRPVCLIARTARTGMFCRTFSFTSAYRQQASQQQDGKTTHFGFETVPEAEKEARGMLIKGQYGLIKLADIVT